MAHDQRADVHTAHAPRKLAADIEIYWLPGRRQTDAAREERPPVLLQRAELEYVCVLQEEVAFLGKEQTEAGQVYLPVVDLGG